MIFGPDLAAPDVVPSVITDPVAWTNRMASQTIGYIRDLQMTEPAFTPPLVGLAGALLGVRPLGEAIAAITGALQVPPPTLRYQPQHPALATFADAVNRASRQVCDHAEDCWSRRAGTLVAGSEEWAVAVRECGVVVAEADIAERRLMVFERGLRVAIRSADAAADLDEDDRDGVIGRLVIEVQAAGRRHSPPSVLAERGVV